MLDPRIRFIETTMLCQNGTFWALFLKVENIDDATAVFKNLELSVIKELPSREYPPEYIIKASLGTLKASANNLLGAEERRLLTHDHFFEEIFTLGQEESLKYDDVMATDTSIVIEQSPVQITDLVSVIKSGSGAVIGAYTGFAAAGQHPLLLLLTVPLGIIICSSAMGLGQGTELALKEGLKDSLKDRIKAQLAWQILSEGRLGGPISTPRLAPPAQGSSEPGLAARDEDAVYLPDLHAGEGARTTAPKSRRPPQSRASRSRNVQKTTPIEGKSPSVRPVTEPTKSPPRGRWWKFW